MIEHGTVYGYTSGCRCKVCADNWRSYMRQWKAAKLADPACSHGVRVTYMAGCRCDGCRRANADYNLSRKAKLRTSERPTPHGTTDGYGSFGCRCASCVAAKRAATRAHYLEHQLSFIERNESRKAAKAKDARKVTARDIERLIGRHGGRCAYCGISPEFLEIDHVVPLKRGGRHAIGNLLPACRPCNRAKSARLLVEFRRKVAA